MTDRDADWTDWPITRLHTTLTHIPAANDDDDTAATQAAQSPTPEARRVVDCVRRLFRRTARPPLDLSKYDRSALLERYGFLCEMVASYGWTYELGHARCALLDAYNARLEEQIAGLEEASRAR